MRLFKRLGLVVAVLITVMLSVGGAEAATLTLGPSDPIQHTDNSPCIFPHSSCDLLTPGAGTAPGTIPSNGSYDDQSLIYTVGQLTNLFGNFLAVGVDVSDNGTAQSLDLFEMYINDSLVDSYYGPTNVPVVNNPGNGFSDYAFTGFTSLAGYDATAQVYFLLKMSNLNDGPEQLFLYTGPVVSQTTSTANTTTTTSTTPNLTAATPSTDTPSGAAPEPTVMTLLGAGLVLAGRRLRRRKA